MMSKHATQIIKNKVAFRQPHDVYGRNDSCGSGLVNHGTVPVEIKGSVPFFGPLDPHAHPPRVPE